MKLKGFTIAEVLITMTLIGVIATLTLPALMTDVQRQQAGPAFMKAFGILDTANALLIDENDWYNFRSCSGNGDYSNCFSSFVARKLSATSVTAPAYNGFYGGELNLAGDAWLSKNGFIYYLASESPEGGNEGNGGAEGNEGAENEDYYDLYIDVNGLKGPNILGKDLFHVVVDVNDGNVFAKGSNLDPTSGDGTRWTDLCPASGVAEGHNGDACAGAITDNNGRVPYRF